MAKVYRFIEKREVLDCDSFGRPRKRSDNHGKPFQLRVCGPVATYPAGTFVHLANRARRARVTGSIKVCFAPKV